MAKLITVAGSIANPLAPRILRTPGVGGYAARFIASHIQQAEKSTLTEWPSVGGSVPTVLTPSAGVQSTLTLQTDNGVPCVQADGGYATGGRLLGPNIGTRPTTIAGVFKAARGATGFAGGNAARFSRNDAEGGYYISNGGAYSLENPDGWVFMLITLAADGSFTLRVNAYEMSKPAPGIGVAGNYNGLYFGAEVAGQTAKARELIYWPKQLNATERGQVHAYMRSRYSDLA